MATTTTQLTSKRLKAQKLIGQTLVALGFLTFVCGSQEPAVVPIFLLLLSGSVCYIQAIIRIWWNHK